MQGKSTDPFKRHKTRHRGITYRERADGSRTYYVYAAGRQHAIQGGERDALAKQAELRGKLARGERVVTANRLFRELAEEWFEAKKPRLRPRVAAGYRTSLDLYVLPAVGDRKLGQVTVQAVAELACELEAKGLTRATVLNHLKPIRASFAYAIRRGMASYNPVDQLEPDELPAASTRKARIPTDEEIADLFSAAARFVSRRGYDYHPLLELAIYAGLRKGEVLGLEWQDFDPAARCLYVRRQWTKDGLVDEPKTKASTRRVPLPAATVKRLAELKLRSRFAGDEAPIFCTRNGTHLGHDNVHRAWVKLKDEAQIEGLRFHELRHAAASILIGQGLTPVEVAAVLGHANPNITLSTYAHLWRPESAEEKVRAALQGAMEAQN
jgi:integrase